MNRKRKIVCLCGSTRFPEAFHLANLHETLRGRIVVSVGMFGHADLPTGAKHLTDDGNEANHVKSHLDSLHLDKINLADEILVINVGGYIGSSTEREIAHARSLNIPVRYLFP